MKEVKGISDNAKRIFLKKKGMDDEMVDQAFRRLYGKYEREENNEKNVEVNEVNLGLREILVS